VCEVVMVMVRGVVVGGGERQQNTETHKSSTRLMNISGDRKLRQRRTLAQSVNRAENSPVAAIAFLSAAASFFTATSASFRLRSLSCSYNRSEIRRTTHHHEKPKKLFFPSVSRQANNKAPKPK